MVKKWIFAIIMVLVISAAIIYVVPWGNYESNLVKSDLDETPEQTDSTGHKIPSLVSLQGLYLLEEGDARVGELLFEIDGLKNTKGAFENFDISFDIGENYDSSQLDVIIDAGSVNTNNSMRDESLVSDEFFDVKKYPTIAFHASEIEFADTVYFAHGTLSLMAESKELSVPFKHLGSGTSKSGKDFEAFEGTFSFDRTAYGMPEESGVGNIVTISFYCELIMKE